MDFVKWAYWRFLRRGVARIRPSVVASLAGPLSLATMLLAPGRRATMLAELAASGLLAGRGPGILRESFRSHLVTQIKMSYLDRIGARNVGTWLPIEGLENLDRALERGRGAILLNPHFGPFMMAMPALGHRGYKVNQVALQGEPIIGRREGFGRRAYRAKFDGIERNMPVRFINAAGNPMALREAIRALERNEVVLFASTGRGGKAWRVVPFLGRQATFSLTPFNLAARTGSVLLPVFVMNAAVFARILVLPPLGQDPGSDPEKSLTEYAALLSDHVRRSPEQFAAFLHDMRRNAWWDDHPFFSDYPFPGKSAEDAGRPGR